MGHMFKKYLLNNLLFCLSLLSLLVLVGCNDNSQKTNNNSGSAIKGVISNGIIKVYSTLQDKQLLEESRTNVFGQFNLELENNYPDTFFLLELSVDNDTRMRCDLIIGCINNLNGQLVNFGGILPLPSNFKLFGLAYSDKNKKVSAYITPLSHLIVSTAIKNNQNLNKESIKVATSWVNDAFKLSQSPIQTQPKDITQLLTYQPIMTDEQLKQSILGAVMYPEAISLDWSLGNASIDSIDLKSILSRASELAGDLSALIEVSNPNQTTALNRIQSDAEAQLVTLNTSDIIILSQPSSITSLENDSFSLYVQANSDLNLSYQWYKNGALIPGENTAIYTKSVSSTNDSGLYNVFVSNSLSEIRSLSASVTVNKAEQVLQITQQPQGQSITEGDSISLSVSATGDGEIQYQWQKNGSLIPGATASTYLVSSSQVQDAGSYRVVISNNSKQINSNFVNVWVTESVQEISITQQPESLTVVEGNAATFSVSANGGGLINYQWRKNGIDINNAFSSSLTVHSVNLSNTGNYDVIIANSQGSLTSLSANLAVLADLIPVMITKQPQAQTIISGSPFTLSVSANGTNGEAPLIYQWFLDGNAIDSANSAQYQILSASSEDQGRYTVLINNTGSSELSNAAQITINQAELASIELTWDTPSAREDGSALSFYEIQGYVIEYGTSSTSLQNRVNVDNLLPNSLMISDLMPGNLYLRIATVDSDGRQGEFSQTISITIL
jgi:hypothetical protein